MNRNKYYSTLSLVLAFSFVTPSKAAVPPPTLAIFGLKPISELMRERRALKERAKKLERVKDLEEKEIPAAQKRFDLASSNYETFVDRKSELESKIYQLHEPERRLRGLKDNLNKAQREYDEHYIKRKWDSSYEENLEKAKADVLQCMNEIKANDGQIKKLEQLLFLLEREGMTIQVEYKEAERELQKLKDELEKLKKESEL